MAFYRTLIGVQWNEITNFKLLLEESYQSEQASQDELSRYKNRLQNKDNELEVKEALLSAAEKSLAAERKAH